MIQEHAVTVLSHHTYTPCDKAKAAGIAPFNYYNLLIEDWVDDKKVIVTTAETTEPILYHTITEMVGDNKLPLKLIEKISGMISTISYFSLERTIEEFPTQKDEIETTLASRGHLTSELKFFK